MPRQKPVQCDPPSADPRNLDEFERAALRYLTRRDRTQAQLRAYLRRVGTPPAVTRMLIKRLQARGYLNDEAYALRWARSRLARRPMGQDRLEAELLGQGLDRAIVLRTLALVYAETSERELASRLLARRSGTGRSGTPSRTAMLLRRYGFGEETIEAVMSGVRCPEEA